MTRNDTNVKESTEPGWERIGQELFDRERRPRAGRVHTQLHELAEQIQTRQEPGADELRAAWEHLDMVTRLADEHLRPTDCGTILTELGDNFENQDWLCTEDAD